MHVQTYLLSRGNRLSRPITDDGGFTAIYGEGGGCMLDVAGHAAGLWIPLRGTLQVQVAGLVRPLRVSEALVTEYETRVRAIGHANGCWLALLGARAAWRRLLGQRTSEAQLLPETHHADRELRRRAIAVVRASTPFELEGAVHAIADVLASLQAPLHAAIARCPGRTNAKRRQVFLRLHRVRNFMSACCDREIDNDALARMANYSPCHFLRTFSLVYQETPHAYLVDQRLQLARRLLSSGDLAVSEVALASGFENRSAFSRVFRQRFGTTAQATKRRRRAPTRANDTGAR